MYTTAGCCVQSLLTVLHDGPLYLPYRGTQKASYAISNLCSMMP